MEKVKCIDCKKLTKDKGEKGVCYKCTITGEVIYFPQLQTCNA